MADSSFNPVPSDGSSAGKTPQVQIRGVSAYESALRMFTIAHRTMKQQEIRVSKAHVTLLEGKNNWEVWRMRLATILQPVAGGRLWHLMLNHPSTTVEAYRHILAPEDDKPVDFEEANAIRGFDLADVANAINQTLTDRIAEDVNPPSEDFLIPADGQVIWNKLVDKFASQDIASLQEAEAELSSFKLGNRTAVEVGRNLQGIFSRIFNAGGGAVQEHRKIGAVLKCYTQSPLMNDTRAAIQQTWSNKHEFTFDEVVKRFAAEEALLGVHRQSEPESSDGAQALRIQHGSSMPQSSSQKQPSQQQQTGANRPNNARRNKAKTGSKCNWCNIVGHMGSDCRKRRDGHPPHPQSYAASQGWTNQPLHQLNAGYPQPQLVPAPYAVGARAMMVHPGMMHATALHASHFGGYDHPGPYVYPAYAAPVPAQPH